MIPDSISRPPHVVVTTRRRGLEPTAHLPSEDDPDQPRCRQGLTPGGDWRREDPEDFDEDQFCQRCLTNDSLGKSGDHSLYLRCVEIGREGSA